MDAITSASYGGDAIVNDGTGVTLTFSASSLRYNFQPITAIEPRKPVILLGSGLTAVDTALTLLQANPHRTIDMISRRGLVPQAHRHAAPRELGPLPREIQPGVGLRRLVRVLRKHIAAQGAPELHWRDALNSLRPITQSLWQQCSPRDRQQFLRYVQPYWDNHRHRTAPDAHRAIEDAMERGVLRIHSGRIRDLSPHEDGVIMHYLPRGGGVNPRRLKGAYVINCTGPSTRLAQAGDSLVAQLFDRGTIRSDALGLGLEVSEEMQPIAKDGSTTHGLFYIGPLLKGNYWEATTVPELRRFVEHLAAHLLSTV
jgi:uncharacterized NAD(P)/FAD-binding protein YdhS